MQFINILEILGALAFAISGAFAAMDKKLDLLGILVIAFVTAIGGGTIRDIMIGNLPVAWFSSPQTIIVIFISAGTALFFGGMVKRFVWVLLVFDALGLGLFTLTGLQIGIAQGFSPGLCITLGAITACFGGVLRDVLLNNVPLIFQKEIYASACILGGILYFVFEKIPAIAGISNILAIAVIVILRLLAVRYHWSLPTIESRKQVAGNKPE